MTEWYTRQWQLQIRSVGRWLTEECWQSRIYSLSCYVPTTGPWTSGRTSGVLPPAAVTWLLLRWTSIRRWNGRTPKKLCAPTVSEPQNNALAGVGIPIKEEVCRSSRLNLASRRAEKDCYQESRIRHDFWQRQKKIRVMYLFEQGKGNGSRCQSERDIICQRVKFLSDGRRDM